ncbi:MAG: hydroxymethylbilane synthase [Nitrososphaerota archaeon]|nr:hydroxymethylbilane synthase [Nitrososphaerota archaeon]
MRKLRIGTRGSRLALAQTHIVLDLLSQETPGLGAQIQVVKTTGDRLPPEKRGETDGKGAFTDEIESLLIRGRIDLAVHSMKDLSVEVGSGLVIAATPVRGDPRDALVTSGGQGLADLRKGAILGTSSMRRRAQLLNMRNDLRLVDLHGNVETRISKMHRLGLDGVVLAAAGLDRLSLGDVITRRFSTDEVVPAAGQGTLAVEIREGDEELAKIVSRINDDRTMRASRCERAFARATGGDCYVPVGAYAADDGRSLTLTGMIASPDGEHLLKRTMTATDAEGLGETLALEMLQDGGAGILVRAGT